MKFRIKLKFLPIAMTVALSSCTTTCGQGAGDRETVGNGAEASKPPAPAMDVAAAGCIDGGKAIEHIEKIVAFGPRHAGTKGAEDTRKYIVDTLEGFGLNAVRRDFVAHTPHPDMRRVDMANITVDLGASEGKRVIVGGHFDGKIIEEGVFQGANDGGSSTGLLLEMARCLKENPPPVPIRLAFFDGEEALLHWTDSDSLYGSKRMAADLLEHSEHKKIAAMINIDMIGDSRLRIFRETLSTKWVFEALERTAHALGYADLMKGPRAAVEDDHVPFLRVGIPAANLIDLRFGAGYVSNEYWHTDRDTVDKLSADSITAVGRIVLETLPALVRPTDE